MLGETAEDLWEGWETPAQDHRRNPQPRVPLPWPSMAIAMQRGASPQYNWEAKYLDVYINNFNEQGNKTLQAIANIKVGSLSAVPQTG